MDQWDVLLIVIAGYIAVASLVRMMAQRHNQVVDTVREQIGNQHKPSENSTDQQQDDTDRGAA